jgi:hypothetical protein
MSKRSKYSPRQRGRGLAVSVAGLRAGGAFALGSALERLRGGEGDSSELMRREARRFTAELGASRAAT